MALGPNVLGWCEKRDPSFSWRDSNGGILVFVDGGRVVVIAVEWYVCFGIVTALAGFWLLSSLSLEVPTFS